MYYRDAVAAVICYDLSNTESFDSVKYWVNEMSDKNNIGNYFLCISGNKCDLPKEQWEITEERVNETK